MPQGFRRLITPWVFFILFTVLYAFMFFGGAKGPLVALAAYLYGAMLAFFFPFLILVLKGMRIVKQYEKAVILRLGHYEGLFGPGVVFADPILDTVMVFDLRVQSIDIPSQEVLTKDNINIKVDAVILYRVLDPGKAFMSVTNVRQILYQYGQANLREVLGVHELDEILQKREEMAKLIQEEVDKMVGEWGIKVISVALQQIYLPQSMIRAMAMQAEAERERRAKIISADGEKQAAAIMAEAASYYEKHPVAMRLRELTTLVEIAKEKNLIIIYPSSFGELNKELGVLLGLTRKSQNE